MVAAAGAPVGAVEVEGLGRKPGQARVVVEGLQLCGLLGEACRRGEVDLDDAGIRRDGGELQAGIRWRTVALHDQRAAHRRCGRLQPSDQIDEVVHRIGGRQEDVQRPVADLGDQCGGGVGLGVLHEGVIGRGAGR